MSEREDVATANMTSVYADMHDLSDVIKNPDRQKKTVEPYTPEYQRLGKDPVVVPYDPAIFSKPDAGVPKQVHANVGQSSNWFEPPQNITSSAIDSSTKAKRVVSAKTVNNNVSIANGSNDIVEGQYCLLIRNKIFAISDSKSEIENMIESILFDDGKEFENLTINDLVLIKRMPIRVGVVVSDVNR